jgi:hypothetical protein
MEQLDWFFKLFNGAVSAECVIGYTVELDCKMVCDG